MKLNRHRIVEAAIALVDRDGLPGLNMRSLAAVLEVRAAGLYYHVNSRDQLIELMAQHLYKEAFDEVGIHGHSHDWAIAFGTSLLAVFDRHRDSAAICAIAPLNQGDSGALRTLAAPLRSLGLEYETALTLQASIVAYSLGWSIYRQGKRSSSWLGQAFNLDKAYFMGLEAMVVGFGNAGSSGSRRPVKILAAHPNSSNSLTSDRPAI